MRTDDRAAVLVGVLGWAVALLALATVALVRGEDMLSLAMWTAIAGLVSGLILLGYTQLRRGR